MAEFFASLTLCDWLLVGSLPLIFFVMDVVDDLIWHRRYERHCREESERRREAIRELVRRERANEGDR